MFHAWVTIHKNQIKGSLPTSCLPFFLPSSPTSTVAVASNIRYFLHRASTFLPPFTLYFLTYPYWDTSAGCSWYLQQVILMPPLFSPGSHILFMLMNIYSEQHLWSIFLSSLTFAEKNKQEARRANRATERARTLWEHWK